MTKWRWVSKSDSNWCEVIGTVANLIMQSQTDELRSWIEEQRHMCSSHELFSPHLNFSGNRPSMSFSFQSSKTTMSLLVVYWHILRRLAKPARRREIVWRSNPLHSTRCGEMSALKSGVSKMLDQRPRLNEIKLSILFLLSCRTTTLDATTSKRVMLPTRMCQGCNANSALASLIRWAPDYLPLDEGDKYIIISHQSQSLKIFS